MIKKYYTIKEVAEYLNYHPRSIRNAIYKGRIDSVKLYNKRMIKRETLIALIKYGEGKGRPKGEPNLKEETIRQMEKQFVMTDEEACNLFLKRLQETKAEETKDPNWIKGLFKKKK